MEPQMSNTECLAHFRTLSFTLRDLLIDDHLFPLSTREKMWTSVHDMLAKTTRCDAQFDFAPARKHIGFDPNNTTTVAWRSLANNFNERLVQWDFHDHLSRAIEYFILSKSAEVFLE